MKTIRLRLEVTADDGAAIDLVQRHLRETVSKLGTQSIGQTVEEGDLGGEIVTPRVFWETCEVKQGADRTPEPAAKRLRVAK